jgi:flagellar biosynthetic protein FliO
VWVLLQTTSAPSSPVITGGYGAALLQAVLALLAVSVLAWVVLRGLARGGMLRGGSGRIRVLERTPLDARHSLVLVQVDGETLLLGVGDGSAPTLIEKLATPPASEDDAAPAGSKPARQSFSAALARVRLARAADSSRDEKNDV